MNDVTDRESQILDPDRVFTQAKARTGYLPSGPWLVAGSQLVQGASDRALDLKLSVDRNLRQDASTKDMMVGLPEILTRLGALGNCQTGSKQGDLYCTMPDVGNKERRMVQGPTLPAGSIVLTGTPGGVALKAPDLAGRAVLFLRGGFNTQGAREVFLADQKTGSRYAWLSPKRRRSPSKCGTLRQSHLAS